MVLARYSNVYEMRPTELNFCPAALPADWYIFIYVLEIQQDDHLPADLQIWEQLSGEENSREGGEPKIDLINRVGASTEPTNVIISYPIWVDGWFPFDDHSSLIIVPHVAPSRSPLNPTKLEPLSISVLHRFVPVRTIHNL